MKREGLRRRWRGKRREGLRVAKGREELRVGKRGGLRVGKGEG